MIVHAVGMEWFAADGYHVARVLVQRGVALVYLLAFINIIREWRGLLGERGLLPVPEFTRRAPFTAAPSVFFWRYDDRFAMALAWLGGAVSAALVLGAAQRGPAWLVMLAYALLWAIYLSYVNVGQVFYAFGWESLLLETGFLVIFLGASELAPPWLIIFALRWLLFRVEFGAGMIKLRGDPCWRQLTCTRYHHETQPLPGPLSAWFHHRPDWVHRGEVAANHAVQLIAPFGLFLPQPIAGAAAILVVVTQSWLMLSGNFSWLNLLTIVLAFAALPDAWFAALGVAVEQSTQQPIWFVAMVSVIAAMIAWRSLPTIANLLSTRQRMNASFDPLRLVNTYGAFGSVTRVRRELVIEATDAAPVDGRIPDDAVWRPYEFHAKPTSPRRRPRQVAPYHLRLDWLLWFAAMNPLPHTERWFRRLIDGLLAADPRVCSLLRRAPFGATPPTAVRVASMRYRFATPQQRRETGRWWVRDEAHVVLGPVAAGVRPG